MTANHEPKRGVEQFIEHLIKVADCSLTEPDASLRKHSDTDSQLVSAARDDVARFFRPMLQIIDNINDPQVRTFALQCLSSLLAGAVLIGRYVVSATASTEQYHASLQAAKARHMHAARAQPRKQIIRDAIEAEVRKRVPFKELHYRVNKRIEKAGLKPLSESSMRRWLKKFGHSLRSRKLNRLRE